MYSRLEVSSEDVYKILCKHGITSWQRAETIFDECVYDSKIELNEKNLEKYLIDCGAI